MKRYIESEYFRPVLAGFCVGMLILVSSLLLSFGLNEGKESDDEEYKVSLQQYVSLSKSVMDGNDIPADYSNYMTEKMKEDIERMKENSDYSNTLSRAFPVEIKESHLYAVYKPGKKPISIGDGGRNESLDAAPLEGKKRILVVKGKSLMKSGLDKEPKEESFVATLSSGKGIQNIGWRVESFYPYSERNSNDEE